MFKIVVGLGNPGTKYEGTRHNIGFQVLDAFHGKSSSATTRLTLGAKVSAVEIGPTKVLLVWPQTYMNNSGRCVRQVVGFYKIDFEKDLLIVCDDLSLPLGKLRVRSQGSAGGQKGLADILQELSSQTVARLRIGIDACPDHWDAADYVLGRFRKEEQPVMDLAVERACLAVEAWCVSGIEQCMNHFNK